MRGQLRRAPSPARLSRSGDFDRVYREGSSRGNRFLVLHAFARGESDAAANPRVSGPRLGVSVGKRIGKAVVSATRSSGPSESPSGSSRRMPPSPTATS